MMESPTTKATSGMSQWAWLTSLQLSIILLSITPRPAHAYERYRYYNQYQAQERPPYTPSSCESTSFRALPISLKHEHQCLAIEALTERVRGALEARRNGHNDISHRLTVIESKLSHALRRTHKRPRSNIQPGLRDIPTARDCHELWTRGIHITGVYPITLPSGGVVNVLCDMDTDGGGWTVIQNRADGLVNFSRGWDDYAFGFGNVNTEYWLGNEYIHSITSHTRYSLLVKMQDWHDNSAIALYDTFHVGPETTGYRLTAEKYRASSSAGDALKHHSGMKFSTIDRDHDNWASSCAAVGGGGWWYNRCSLCSLNGEYVRGGEGTTSGRGITWSTWKGSASQSLLRVTMMIKTFAAVMHHEAMVNFTSSGDGDDEAPLFH